MKLVLDILLNKQSNNGIAKKTEGVNNYPSKDCSRDSHKNLRKNSKLFHVKIVASKFRITLISRSAFMTHSERKVDIVRKKLILLIEIHCGFSSRSHSNDRSSRQNYDSYLSSLKLSINSTIATIGQIDLIELILSILVSNFINSILSVLLHLLDSCKFCDCSHLLEHIQFLVDL